MSIWPSSDAGKNAEPTVVRDAALHTNKINIRINTRSL
jgi:hypothetical protein